MARTITDHEIALIKGMLNLGMANNKIQMYFNTMQRPVNSGRITGIKNGTYSNSARIAPASEDDVKLFIRAKDFAHNGSPKANGVLDVSELLALEKALNGVVGHDNQNPGNYSVLPLTDSQLNIIRFSLKIAIESQEIPKWSESTVMFLRGTKAVLKELEETINQASATVKAALIPLLKLLNSAISKMQKMLEALKFEE